MIHRFLALFVARNREFYRDLPALSWNVFFPVLVILGFAYTFSGNDQKVFKAAYVGELTSELRTVPGVEWVQEESVELALPKLRRHSYDLLWESGSSQIQRNKDAPKGEIVERLVRQAAAPVPNATSITTSFVDGRPIRYVDWLICGLLAMNMSFSAFFGVGYTIVRYRKTRVLRRLKATPIRAFEFLMAQVISRFMVIAGVSTFVFWGTHQLVHFHIEGNLWSLALVMALGALCLISMGLVVAARFASEEFAGGLLNLISWPMMFLSGVWFSLEGAHPWVKMFAKIFPLTHLIDASRKIMTEGATLAQVSTEIWVLGVMTAVFLFLGSVLFRWE